MLSLRNDILDTDWYKNFAQFISKSSDDNFNS